MKNLSIVISLLLLLAFLFSFLLQADAISLSQSSNIPRRNSQTGRFRGKRGNSWKIQPGEWNWFLRYLSSESFLQLTHVHLNWYSKATLSLYSFYKGGDGILVVIHQKVITVTMMMDIMALMLSQSWLVCIFIICICCPFLHYVNVCLIHHLSWIPRP